MSRSHAPDRSTPEPVPPGSPPPDEPLRVVIRYGGEFLCSMLVLDVAEAQARFDGLSQHTVAGSCERDDEGGR